MQHLDEGTIHAWLDGELPLAGRDAAEAHIAECVECAAAVAEARGFIAASSRILTALDSVPGGVLPESPAGASSAPRAAGASKRFTIPRAWMAVAAVLVLGIGTVIATKPGADVASLRESAASDTRVSSGNTPAAAAPVVADSIAKERAAPPAAAPRDERLGVTNTPSPKAGGRAARAADKKETSFATERKDQRVAVRDSATMSVADAAPAARPAFPTAPAPTAPAAAAAAGAGTLQPAPPVTRAPAEKSVPSAFTDTARTRRLSLNQVVVSGAAVGPPAPSDSAAPQLVSRNTEAEGTDTIVTTIYTVRGVRISLVDRSPLATFSQTAESAKGFSGAVMAKARAQAPAEHSITWSDSTGRVHTLRGPLTEAELERLKVTLFGATR